MADRGPTRPEDRHGVARRIDDADTLTDLGTAVPSEVLEAARQEVENLTDETDEG